MYERGKTNSQKACRKKSMEELDLLAIKYYYKSYISSLHGFIKSSLKQNGNQKQTYPYAEA